MYKNLIWVAIAQGLVGVKEVKGPSHNPDIVVMWKDIKRSGIKDDETPWCAAFVGSCLERAGIKSSRFESARSYNSWGTELKEPAVGCVAVFSRDGGGHVGFVVGQDKTGSLLVLGGNQGDEVCIRAFPRSRVTGYRWPEGHEVPAGPLPLGNAVLSSRES